MDSAVGFLDHLSVRSVCFRRVPKRGLSGRSHGSVGDTVRGEIQSVTHSIGRSVTVEDLNQMVEEINELYHAKNVVTAKAILPAQTVTDGVVRVRLVEGRIGRFFVEGNKKAVAGYFTDRIRLVPGELVRLDDIAEGSSASTGQRRSGRRSAHAWRGVRHD